MMPVRTVKRGKQWCVVDSTGKVKKGRCHATRKKAIAQTQAINISLKKKGKI